MQSMSESSKGVRETLEGLLYYQARTEALLGHLLGRTYTLGDAAFYMGGASLAMASGLLPRTRPARLPLLAVWGASLATERSLLSRLYPHLHIDPAGQALLPLPAPLVNVRSWLGEVPERASAPLRVDLKGLLRKTAVVLGLLLVLAAAFYYRDYERESFRLLQQMEERMRTNEAHFREHLKLQRQAIITDLGRLIRQQQLAEGRSPRGKHARAAYAAAAQGPLGEPEHGYPWNQEQAGEAPLTPLMLAGGGGSGREPRFPQGPSKDHGEAGRLPDQAGHAAPELGREFLGGLRTPSFLVELQQEGAQGQQHPQEIVVMGTEAGVGTGSPERSRGGKPPIPDGTPPPVESAHVHLTPQDNPSGTRSERRRAGSGPKRKGSSQGALSDAPQGGKKRKNPSARAPKASAEPGSEQSLPATSDAVTEAQSSRRRKLQT
eukprot:jgi/Botrbrau1/11540/Bobra.0393s0018.1